jgi:hypothetical protein
MGIFFLAHHPQDMPAVLHPATDLERRLLDDPGLQAGLAWGSRRRGHPEGAVGEHVAAMLARIPADDPLRDDLRVLALVHDSFKASVASTEGKDLSFLWWFRRELAAGGLLPTHAIAPRIERGGGEDHLYVKTFAVAPDTQAAVAAAARELVTEHAAHLEADGAVFTSDDGLRVLLVWKWPGADAGRLLRDGDVVREALAAHPVLARADALDARLFTGA